LRSIDTMQSPHTDSAEYADLLEHIGSAIRLPLPVAEDDHPANHGWSTRAMAMTQTFVAMAVAAARPSA